MRFTKCAAVLAGACLAMALAGCGGGGSPANGNPDSGPPDEPTGTLRLATFRAPVSIDPQLSSPFDTPYIVASYDTLTWLKDNREPQPWVATEWSAEKDNTIWKVTLRDDVVFHDGTPLDAAAVKKSFDRGVALGPTSPSYKTYRKIEEVTAVDATHVTFAFNTPAPNFPYEMSTIAAAIISPKAIDSKQDLTTTMAGSGGWVYDPDASEAGVNYVYQANDDYWNADAVKVATLDYQPITDNTARVSALEAGQIDIAATVQTSQRADLESGGFRLVDSSSDMQGLLILDRGGKLAPALADERVRQAIGMLIDRDAYNKAILGGAGQPQYGSLMPPNSEFYDAKLDSVPSFDVNGAKALLAEAGYPDGFEVTIGSSPVLAPRVQAIQQLLAAGGIDVKIVQDSNDTLYQNTAAGKYSLYQANSQAVDPETLYGNFIGNNGNLNPFKLTDTADLDKLMAEAGKATGDERVTLADQAQEEIVDHGILFVLGYGYQTNALSPNVRGDAQLGAEELAVRPYFLYLTS